MKILKVKNKNVWAYLLDMDPNTWCRYQFKPASKTDLVVNNLAESFNNKILGGRDMDVVSLMEYISKMLIWDFEKNKKNKKCVNAKW